MQKRALVAVCLLLASVSLAGVLYQTGDVPTDETLTRLDVDSEGDAVFVLELRTVLGTDDKRAAFESFASEIDEDPESAVSDFRDSVEPVVERASEQTGREMSASNFTVETRREPLPVERGVVEYRFVWSGFARMDDGVRAGDVLSGYILGEKDVLVLRAPDGYVVSSAEPAPDTTRGDTVRWDGAVDFAEDEPRVVFVHEADGNGGSDAGNSRSGPDDETGEDDKGTQEVTTEDAKDNISDTDDDEVPLYVYAVVLVVVISVVAVVYHNAGTDEDTGDASAEEAVEVPDQEARKEPESDDERVLRMIESEGGRMKQKRVVEETGWSEAKVSKLTSRMEDEGDITKIRLGRENILETTDEKEGEDLV